MLRKRKCKEFLILVHTLWLLRLKLLWVTCEKATIEGLLCILLLIRCWWRTERFALSGRLGVCAWCLHHKPQRAALLLPDHRKLVESEGFRMTLVVRMFLIRTVV